MSKKYNIKRRNAVPTQTSKVPSSNVKDNQSNVKDNQSNGSVMGNVVGGMASGFGVGTGIEAARGIFGSNQQNTATEAKGNDQGCQILSDMITKCKEKNDGFNDCNDLLEMFSNKCLSN